MPLRLMAIVYLTYNHTDFSLTQIIHQIRHSLSELCVFLDSGRLMNLR